MNDPRKEGQPPAASPALSLLLRPRMTFWTVALGALVTVFLVITFIRFTRGLGAVTNLSDAFPWGIWIGFDILCGVGLAAGAFTLTAVARLAGPR